MAGSCEDVVGGDVVAHADIEELVLETVEEYVLLYEEIWREWNGE